MDGDPGIWAKFRRFFHAGGEKKAATEDEIRMMVDAGNEKGIIDSSEKEMIHNVFEFDDISADEICTHRTDAAIIWEEDSPEEWEKIIHESRHSHFPVCGETADDVLGVLDAKDFFRLKDKTKENIMKEAVRPAWFVPGTIRAAQLFQNMKKTGNYFAVVLDEYGGMDGIITMRDLVEQLVGELQEDDEPRAEEITQLSPTLWKIQGSAELDEVAEKLHLPLPVDDYDTFGGYIFGAMGSIPEDGTRFEINLGGMHIRVLQVKDHRVEMTLVRPVKKKAEQDAAEETDREKNNAEAM